MSDQSCRPAISILIPLAMSLLCWVSLFVPKPSHCREAPPVKAAVLVVERGEVFAPARRSRRALVFLDSPASVYAALNRRNFEAAALTITSSGLRVEFYWVKVGFADWCREWLRSLGELAQQVDDEMPIRNGGVILWLENGLVVDIENERHMPTSEDLASRTARRWGR